MESDVQYAVTQGLTLSSSFSLLQPKLTQEYCDDPAQCGTPGYENYAPAGQQLPVTPKFKGDVTARYTFALSDAYKAHLQASVFHVGARDRRSALRGRRGPG